MKSSARPCMMLPKYRPRWVAAIFVLGFLAILVKDIQIQVVYASRLRYQGALRYFRIERIPAQRGVIYAVNGFPLAVNVPASTIWGAPYLLDKNKAERSHLSNALGITIDQLSNRLQSGGDDFAYLTRQVSPQVGAAVLRLGISGVGVVPTSRTYFPLGAATTPLIGLINQSHQGATGLELTYNRWLKAHPGSEDAILDGSRQIVKIVKIRRLSRSGHAMHLTIEPNMQYWAYVALTRALRHFHAWNGSAVLMNVHTGAILAMVSAPSCNPNNPDGCQHPADYVNNAVHQAFEPGSVMKPFAIAAALATHRVFPKQSFNVSHPLWVGGYAITDDVPHHTLNIKHILKYSSCIGTAEIALRTPKRAIYDMYRSVGFGVMPPLGLPGETAGVLPAWQSWGVARHATIALGYGISVTTMQLAAAYASIANGGWYVRPRLFVGEKVFRRRVMPAWVVSDLQRWLQSVARPGGTGIMAAISGYNVAGKTGTANMANGKDGFYRHRTNATFVGFAPGSHPDLVMAVSLRGSHYSWNFGGIEAAPVFRFTMRRALLTLGIPPRCNIGGKFMKVIVTDGTDLHKLALKYHSTSTYLMQINHLINPKDLYAGSYIKVPTPINQKDFCRIQMPAITRAQAEVWSEGGGVRMDVNAK